MNINPTIFVQESDKKFLWGFLIALVFIFAVIGLLGLLITRIMKRQGKKMDDLMYDIVMTHVVDNPKDFIRVARKKNYIYFVKKAIIPFLIILLGVLLLIIAEAINNWQYKIFDHTKTGFGTILFLWGFNDPSCYTNWFGLTILCAWPPLINTPHPEVTAIWSYFIVPFLFGGGIWYLVNVQALLSRTIKMYKLSKSLFDKSLEDINMNHDGELSKEALEKSVENLDQK